MRCLPFLTLPLLLLASACTVGPDYRGPGPLTVVKPDARFVRAAAAGATADPAGPGLAAWWTAMGDPILDEIERRALAASPDLAVARARLRQARAGVRLERANQLPNANASAIYLHGDLPPTNLGVGSGQAEASSGDAEAGGRSSLDFYNVGFDASWEVDLFGGKRRAVQAARAAADAAEADVADAQVSLAAEIAKAYVLLRDRQNRVEAARRSGAIRRDILTTLRRRVAAGTATPLDADRLDQRSIQADAGLAPLEAERDAYADEIAVLAGGAPGSMAELLAAPAPIPMRPAAVAIGDPAELLRRRPDVRAAERRLASQTAKIGVAEAGRFPRISFMGLIGFGGSQPGDVVDPSDLSLLTFPRLSWNFLDFGRNLARVHQAEGVRDEAQARFDRPC